LAVLAAVTPAEAVFTKIGMAGLPFLKIGVGRCTGMGEAFVAVADDATAAFWNPAGLALVQKRQALVNHIDWVADTIQCSLHTSSYTPDQDAHDYAISSATSRACRPSR
jgi:long-subunit fatty acid transport protein